MRPPWCCSRCGQWTPPLAPAPAPAPRRRLVAASVAFAFAVGLLLGALAGVATGLTESMR